MEELKTPKQEVITLTPFESQISELEELVKDYNNLVVTKENYKEMDEKRLVLYRKRIAIQRDEKANNDLLNKAKKLNSSKAETLIGIIKPKEDDIASKLRAIDEAEELAKQKELDRINAHRKIINSFAFKLIEVMKITEAEVLLEKKLACQDWFSKYNAEEFTEELGGVVQSYTDTIDSLIKVIESKPKPEPKIEYSPENNVVIEGEKPAYVSNIPQDLREKNLAKLSEANAPTLNFKPAIENPEPKSSEPTLEDRAKSGEFSVGVACNLIYGGFKFYVDTRLCEADQYKIKSFITEFIDSVNAKEEVF